MSKVSIDQQIEEVERELKYRGDVYPRLVRTFKMKQSHADFHIARMEVVLETLKWNKDNREHVIDWIRNKPEKKEGQAA
jgi:thymidylate synthase